MNKKQYLFALGLFLCYRLAYKTTPAPGYYLVKRYWFYLALAPTLLIILFLASGAKGVKDNLIQYLKNDTNNFYTFTKSRYKELTFKQKVGAISALWFE